jgi:hypothetical protein
MEYLAIYEDQKYGYIELFSFFRYLLQGEGLSSRSTLSEEISALKILKLRSQVFRPIIYVFSSIVDSHSCTYDDCRLL